MRQIEQFFEATGITQSLLILNAFQDKITSRKFILAHSQGFICSNYDAVYWIDEVPLLISENCNTWDRDKKGYIAGVLTKKAMEKLKTLKVGEKLRCRNHNYVVVSDSFVEPNYFIPIGKGGLY